MSVTKENLQKAIQLHQEWQTHEIWKEQVFKPQYKETRGEEPPEGERFVSHGDLTGANLRGANLIRANLIRAKLTDADLRGANLRSANLRGSNLKDAKLIDANLRGSNLINADLENANLRVANLIDADLENANLIRANLIRADLTGANLIGANLTDAELSGANLKHVIGNGKEIKSMQIDKYHFAWTNMSLAIGCQQHPLKDWLEFSDEKKASFADDGLPYLNKWLPLLDLLGVFDPVK